MSYLLNILKYWKLVGVGILLLIIGIEYWMLNSKEAAINDLTADNYNLGIIIKAKDASIRSYEQKLLDDKDEITAVNNQLNHCTTRLAAQVNDLIAIDNIMESTDEPVIVEPINETTEVKPNATPTITNTTQSKGIDFINSQFDAIK
jgi:hypothetical protein